MTLTVRGTRAAAQRALGLQIADYRLGTRHFFANKRDPELPSHIASSVQAIAGLSALARPHAHKEPIAKALASICKTLGALGGGTADQQQQIRDFCVSSAKLASGYNGPNTIDPPGWDEMNGAGQTIGIIAFDSFQMSDVADYLELIGQPATRIGDVSEIKVNGGAPPGADQDEVLLDLAVVLSIARGAKVVVVHGPFTGAGTSFQSLFNAAINGGSTIISNSFAYCEDQTTLADVQSIDAIFQSAAAAGISILNASGDSGSTCLDGSPNTVAVPAGSPNATAVGGSSHKLSRGYTYGIEKFWDGTSGTPPTGQGGFGVSEFFARPGYQDGFTASAMRSVPDVVADADPAENGGLICQAANGGCPSGLFYGGTSASAPRWAAFVAILNQALGQNIGALNQAIYPFANTEAFHNAASLGSDFDHVGLGSPNLNLLFLKLSGQALGAPNASISEVVPYLEGPFPGTVLPYADGQTPVFVNVRLLDNNGNPVNGKTIALAANAGSQAVISPQSAVTTVANGIAIFTVTNLVPGKVTFTATDVDDGFVLQQTPSVDFVTPPATSASITASPTTVIADGTDTTTVTVTLEDALNRPAPGKHITLAQGNGRSAITGPDPSVTDANGEIRFTATNLFNEVVTYTAVDVTDGDLPVPGNAVVTFTNSTNLCGAGAPTPVGQNGYTVTPLFTGFVARPLVFGGITFGGCPGASTPAFLGNDVFFSDWTGDVIKLPDTGGAVSSANRLANIGKTLAWPVVGKDGRLYATRVATTGNFNTGAILEIDPVTGALIRNVASNVRCPFSLAVDPLSGDLFFDGGRSGGGSDDATIHRIRDPDSATPTLEVYATLPATPNGKMSFAPDGTLYVVTGYFSATPTISVVSGTDGPIPPTVTTLPGVNSFFWVNVAGSDANGAARSLLTLFTVPNTSDVGLQSVDITTNPPTRTLLATNLGGGEIGPDGCLYSPIGNTVYRLTDPTGGCSFASASVSPSLKLTPAVVSPNPPQGSAQTFTATLDNVPTPEGTAVFFTVTGANPQIKLVRADADGQAPFTYTAVQAGDDRIEASTTVNSDTLTSNRVRFTWDSGRHSTFLTLNPSPTGGTLGEPVMVIASLTDVSADPPVPLAGRDVDFSIETGVVGCIGTTDAKGLASCELTPQQAGIGTLTAQFLATGVFVGSSASVGFNVLTPPAAGDQEPPVIVCPADVNTAVGQPVTLGAPSVSDNLDPNPAVVNDAPASFPPGTTTVTWTATDASGNSASCEQEISLTYAFGGFFPPVDNLPVYNQVKAGQAIPVKFSLGGNQGLEIFASGYPVSQGITCNSGSVDAIEETVTAGSSSLSYDPSTDQYNYVWKTKAAWKGTCRQLIVRLKDGTDHKANFNFK